VLTLGDSKTDLSPLGYQPKLLNDLNALNNPAHLWREATPRIATGGWNTSDLHTGVDANIAIFTSVISHHKRVPKEKYIILICLGYVGSTPYLW